MKTQEALGLVEIYKTRKAQQESDHSKRLLKDNKIQLGQRRQILTTLSHFGVKTEDARTNGYWFKFHYKDVAIEFVNQATRICGHFHLQARNKEEEELLKDIRWIRSEEDLKDQLEKEFMYQEFVIDGHPDHGVRTMLTLVDEALQNRKTKQEKELI